MVLYKNAPLQVHFYYYYMHASNTNFINHSLTKNLK